MLQRFHDGFAAGPDQTMENPMGVGGMALHGWVLHTKTFQAMHGEILGGAHTIRQYLSARLVDEMHIAVSPVLLGSGENLWSGINLPELGYECVEYVPSEKAAHVIFKCKR